VFIVSFALLPHITTSEYIYSVIYNLGVLIYVPVGPSIATADGVHWVYKSSGRKRVYGHTASFPNFPLKYSWWSGKKHCRHKRMNIQALRMNKCQKHL